MPHVDAPPRARACAVIVCWIMIAVTAGCSSLWQGNNSQAEQQQALSELMRAPELPELIRDATAPHGMQPVQVEGVGLVNALPGTGGAPDPSRFRDELLDEIKRHDVSNPNRYLESSETALVRVRATIPPGARRGDPIDVRVLAPKISRATNLHGGWLLDTRLRHQQLLNRAIRKSDVMAVGIGRVLTRASFAPGADDSLQLEGIIPAGGRVQKTRKLGLVLKPQFQHAKIAAGLSAAINQRFFFFDGTTRRGISKAVEDDFIELDLHPRYRVNVKRFMSVIRAIPGRQETGSSQERLAELGDQLKVAETAADAAIQLEAIGENAVPTLLTAIDSPDPDVKFFAAEALAYLNRTESIPPLEAAIRDEPNLRRAALLAMQGLQDSQLLDAYGRLIDAPSLEARYGAFTNLRRRADARRMLDTKRFDSFTLYQVPSSAPPTVVVSLREVSEIVLLGDVRPLELKKSVIGSNGLMLTSDTAGGDVRISRFQPGQADQRAVVDNSLASIIAGIAKVGGQYGDVVALLREVKDRAELIDQLAIDPVAGSGRGPARRSVEIADARDPQP